MILALAIVVGYFAIGVLMIRWFAVRDETTRRLLGDETAWFILVVWVLWWVPVTFATYELCCLPLRRALRWLLVPKRWRQE